MKNYQFLSDVTYLKCLENLFEIGLLLPWAEILSVRNLKVELDLELNLKLKGYYLADLAAQLGGSLLYLLK